jgi:hypothetical protein
MLWGTDEFRRIVMKTTPLPLAAALLLCAAASQAQLLNPPPPGGGFSFGAGDAAGVFGPVEGQNPLTKQEPLGGDDFYKKCGTVPYRTCTPAEEKARQQWLKDTAKDKEAPAPVAGPPQVVDMPNKDGKMLQYPDGRVEYCFDASCTKTNGTPLAPDAARSYYWNDYAEQKQMANSINGGEANRKAAVPQLPPGASCTQLSCDVPPVNAFSNGDGGASDDPIVVTGRKQSSGSGFSALSDTSGGSSQGGSSAADDAAAVSNAQDTVTGAGGSRSMKSSGGGGSTTASTGGGYGSSAGGSSSSGSGSGSGSSGAKMLPSEPAKLDNTFSYPVLGAQAQRTEEEAARIRSGQTELATEDGVTVHTVNRAELKVEDPKTLGKIKANAQ